MSQSKQAKRVSRAESGFRLMLVFFSLILTALLCELALRIALPAPSAAAGDTASEDATDEDGFDFFTYHKKLGWDLVPDTEDRHRSGEFDVTIRINSQGLRSDHEIAPEAPPGTRRVVVIGDSFSFGHGVEASEAYPSLLEERLDATEVINLAVTGYGTDQQLLRLVDQGLKWRPDVILLGLFEGNVFRNAREEYLGYPKPRFERLGDDLELVNVPVPRSASRPGLIAGSRLWQVVGKRGWDLVEHLGYGEAWPITEAILARLDKVCRESGARLMVVVIPKDQAIYGRGLRRSLHDRTLAKIDRILERLEIAHLDLTVVLEEYARDPEANALYFSQDGHWTRVAHRVVAEQIVAWLDNSWNFSSV